jgi:DNA-binding transcriptional regulator GbsR (MarR family)
MLTNEQKKLIKDYSSHFENTYQFPPLTSKIYAYLLVTYNQEGVTFDELVEIFNASKSSISTSLNFLTQIKYVEYHTKINNRKRFYRVSNTSTLKRLEKIHSVLSEEKHLTEELKYYLEKNSTTKDDLNLIKSDIYINHLENAILQLAKTIKKLTTLENT